jgi:riboflavin kinase/FMN adenylyltransferase
MDMRCAVVGYNYRFGHRGSGDPGQLETLGRELGFEVAVEPAFLMDGQSVSSTRIRTLLEQGEVEKAAELCGRPYCLSGCVQGGNRVGRRLDAPTANIAVPEEKLIPAQGVYVATLLDGIAEYGAVVNIGVRPTLCDGRGLTIEAHALDCAEDFYQKTLTVSFLRRLRDERRFDSLAALQTQIGRDVLEAREYLKNNNRLCEKPGA